MTELAYQRLEAKAKNKEDEQKIKVKELDTITEAADEASILESGRTLFSGRTLNEPDTPQQIISALDKSPQIMVLDQQTPRVETETSDLLGDSLKYSEKGFLNDTKLLDQ